MSEKADFKPRRRIGMRITAGILSASLVISLAVNAAVAVRIQSVEISEAATNYLVENTEYVNQDILERLQEKFQTIQEPESIEDHYRLAGTQIAEEKYDQALVSIEKCIELFDETQSDELYLDLLMKKGCLEVLLEELDNAQITLSKVLEIDPDQTEVYLVLAQINAQRDDLDGLESCLVQYIDRTPDQPEIRALLAQTLFAKEDFEGAKQQYKLVIDSQSEDVDMAEMNYLYALTNIQTEDYLTAQESLTKALSMDDEMTDAYYYIGICQMSQELYAQAADNFTLAIEKNSMLQLSYYSRGVCGMMIEEYDYQKALDDLKQTTVYSGDDADSEIALQAELLLAELEAIGLENKPESEIILEPNLSNKD